VPRSFKVDRFTVSFCAAAFGLRSVFFIVAPPQSDTRIQPTGWRSK